MKKSLPSNKENRLLLFNSGSIFTGNFEATERAELITATQRTKIFLTTFLKEVQAGFSFAPSILCPQVVTIHCKQNSFIYTHWKKSSPPKQISVI